MKADGAAPINAAAPAAGSDSAPRETGLRRLNRAICHGLCVLCFLIVGVIGGGWLGLRLGHQSAHLGGLVALATCPVGAFFGFSLARWIGQGVGRLMSSYRLTFPGVLLGMAGGLATWGLSAESPYTRLMAADLPWNEWMVLALCAALGGLVLGFVCMLMDAVTNFTR